MSADDDAFVFPAWDADLDVAAAIASCPEGALIKGMMSTALVDAAAAAGQTLPSARPPYLPFQEYSLREHMQLLVEAATLLQPGQPLRLALRRMGRGVRNIVVATPYGRVLFGRSLTGLETAGAIGRCYKVMLGHDVVVEVVDDSCADIVMNDVHHFLDSVHVGVIEGIFGGSGLQVKVGVKMRGPHRATFRVRW